MLIYLKPYAQRETLSLFHFALKRNGVLFLGPSESTGEIDDEFDSIDARWKIYRKRRDVRDVRYVSEHFLGKAGCDVHIAENGREAVDTILQAQSSGEPFELVMMDLQMPILTGDKALQDLRAKDCSIPAIALTADAMNGTRDRLLAVGSDEYLSRR